MKKIRFGIIAVFIASLALFIVLYQKGVITSYIFDEKNNYANIYSRKYNTVFTDKEQEFENELKEIIKSATR